MATPITVLLVSYQPELLAPHAEALSAAGLSVTTVNSMSAALGAVGPGTYKVLVIAHTTPTGDRRRIEGEAKRRNPRIKILLMYSGQPEKDVFASSFVDVNEPPATLTQAVVGLGVS